MSISLPVIPVETVTTLRGLLVSYQYDPISPHHAKPGAARIVDETLLQLIDAGIGETELDAVDEIEALALRAGVRAMVDTGTADAAVAMLHTVMRFGAEQLGIPDCAVAPHPTSQLLSEHHV